MNSTETTHTYPTGIKRQVLIVHKGRETSLIKDKNTVNSLVNKGFKNPELATNYEVVPNNELSNEE